ncbi:MAG TPA: PIN domain-containing protein, partial [Chthoniobacterales bacterium]|nr:PIN domain-containing protein [Chthoniobacterales bacterium]
MHNPTSLFNFQEHDVYIPYEVLGELGKFKKGNAEINVNAREAIRTINRLIGGGFPEDGIPLEVDGKPVGGRLHFLLPEDEKDIGLEDRVEENYVDTVLIKRAKRLHEQNPEDETILVTQDTGFRIRVGALRIPNLKAEDYLHD